MLFIAQLVSYFCTIAIKCHFSAAVDRFRMAWGAKFCAQPRAFGTFNPPTGGSTMAVRATFPSFTIYG